MKKGKITLRISQDRQLNVSQLTEFMALLNATVEALEQRLPEAKKFTTVSKREVNIASELLAGISAIELNEFVKDSRQSNIGILSITRNSPIELTLCGVLILLVLGLIFSGGSFDGNLATGEIKIKLRSFGHGLKKLREALGLNERIEVTFGVQSVKIKLTKEEMKQLMKQKPSTSGQGGFQKFLVGLQYRANKSTRELVLHQEDIERIKKFKANPSKGGFQGRFKKIFGRHF